MRVVDTSLTVRTLNIDPHAGFRDRNETVMAQIIDFHSVRNSRPIREVAAAGGADILFFMGVRYERMTDAALPAPGPADPVGGSRKRRKRRA